mmetsp:Transcript_17672/g.41539  ORF Transcript_17672/g.41539 Transcript_17672/m.41539 type:complete len:138 (+) Transcript_17672:80-493(+)
MAQLNFKRLVVELKKVREAIKVSEDGLVSCQPVDDNMLDWEVNMSFPSESALQKSLDSLSESMFDPELNKLTLAIRFPSEYPLSPPEVWLQRPRMKHSEETAGASRKQRAGLAGQSGVKRGSGFRGLAFRLSFRFRD